MAIKEFDFVILKKETNWKIVQVIRKRQVWMCKMKFNIDGIIGQQFGSTFKIDNGYVVKLDPKDLVDDVDYEKDNAEKDNRNLVDDCDNQKMSKEEICSLRKKGISGDDIVEQLVENSATFSQKTEFSQQKYLKKKRKKHVAVLSVLKPNTRNLVEFYYCRGPTKICNLRMDSLAQILTQANVHSGCRLMVVETCSGLIIGSCLERMAGRGSLVHLYTGTAPNRPAITEGYKFPADYLRILHNFPLNEVATLNRFKSKDASSSTTDEQITGEKNVSTESIEGSEMVDLCIAGDVTSAELESKDSVSDLAASQNADNKDNKSSNSKDHKTKADIRKMLKRKLEDPQEREMRRQLRLKQIEEARVEIEAGSMDSLIVAAKFYPTPVVLSLIDYVAPSRPIVVFSPYKEPLIDCFMKLRDQGRVLMIKLSETWLRNYQVLPERTHPSINMSGCGGYMLTCITVQT